MTVLEILKGARKYLARSSNESSKQYHICFAINDCVFRSCVLSSCNSSQELYENCHEAKRLVEVELGKLFPSASTMWFTETHTRIILGLSSDYGCITIDQTQEARHKFLDRIIANLELNQDTL